jgi:hypothetical protein
VTVSRGPGLKNHKNKRKIGKYKKYLIWDLDLQVSRAPRLSGPRLVYSAHTKENLRVERGPEDIGFTGPVRALDAPERNEEKRFLSSFLKNSTKIENRIKIQSNQKAPKKLQNKESSKSLK